MTGDAQCKGISSQTFSALRCRKKAQADESNKIGITEGLKCGRVEHRRMKVELFERAKIKIRRQMGGDERERRSSGSTVSQLSSLVRLSTVPEQELIK